ncbi:MAG: HEAT repeat domain-containing protein [Desulfosalsimonadaceae bacterium]|nr:HEAT repeat domain-containing protein [Desulfosalsimonadaceae bacterium]
MKDDQQKMVKIECKEGIDVLVPEIPEKLSTADDDHTRPVDGPAEAMSGGLGIRPPDRADEAADGPKTGLSKEWIRKTVNEAEVVFEEPVIEAPGKAIGEKTELSDDERNRIKPVGNFLMNLTKAMLRSGYYEPDHPGGMQAKQGLYQEFRRVLEDADEMMFINRETRDKKDVLISGILDAPVGVKTLVSEGVAGLFLPKLKEYFDRKGLVSFAVKKTIGPEHFEAFVDIMSDPHVDQQENKSTGAYLTNALVGLGITEISVVFVNDLVVLEQELPWRVEMAIQRLAKDLRVMPMFKASSNITFRNMKQQIVMDIIRPLKHPRLLNDFLVNCYIIARHVEDIDAEDIETIIVNAFPYNLLLPTVQFTFQEMDRLIAVRKREPGNNAAAKRILGIKRILKLVARRVTTEAISGAYRFLDQLYQHEILDFNELPADVQYLVKTRQLAEDVRNNLQGYVDLTVNAENAEDAVTYLKCFRRVAPLFIENREWPVLLKIIRAIEPIAVKKIRAEGFASGLKTEKGPGVTDFTDEMTFRDDGAILLRPLIYIFRETIDKLVPLYIGSLKNPVEHRETALMITELIDKTGGFGIEILSRVLAGQTEATIRKAVLLKMLKRGDSARRWALQNLMDPERPWQMLHSAVVVLAQLGKSGSDFEFIRQYRNHPLPMIREAVVEAIVGLRPHDAENQLIAAINDKDARVRWRAVRSLDKLWPLSESAMNTILGIITADPPENQAAFNAHVSQIVNLITAINGMWNILSTSRMEQEVIRAAEKYIKSRSGWKQLLLKDLGRKKSEASPVVKAAIPLLGRIGGRASMHFLKRLIRSNPVYAESAEEAILKITARGEN